MVEPWRSSPPFFIPQKWVRILVSALRGKDAHDTSSRPFQVGKTRNHFLFCLLRHQQCPWDPSGVNSSSLNAGLFIAGWKQNLGLSNLHPRLDSLPCLPLSCSSNRASCRRTYFPFSKQGWFFILEFSAQDGFLFFYRYRGALCYWLSIGWFLWISNICQQMKFLPRLGLLYQKSFFCFCVDCSAW